MGLVLVPDRLSYPKGYTIPKKRPRSISSLINRHT